MSKFVLGIVGLTLALWGVTDRVRAEVVQDLYSAEVPVADQSSAELARASRAALSEVLVKVSGSVQVLGNPVIAAALPKARSQVQQYSYREDPGAPQGLVVNELFDANYITSLIIEAGAPVWTANRPAVLVWLVTEDASGRQFVNADTNPALRAMLLTEFARRGVPVQLPLFDLAETSALSPDQAWRLDDPALVQASARYNLQNVLAGRFSRLASGGVAGEWSYQDGNGQVMRSASVESEELFLREGASLVAEAMSARYAVAASANLGGLVLTVAGVTDYADYSAVVRLLESLELVERADVEQVRGDAITLRVQAQADAAHLATLIELDKRLVPLPSAAAGTQLSYQWQK